MASKRWNREPTVVKLSEAEKLPLQKKISDFIGSGEDELVLPGLSSMHRKYLHQYAARLGLKTRSHGKKDDRTLHIKTPCKLTSLGDCHLFQLPEESKKVLLDMAPNIRDCMYNDNMQQQQRDSHFQQKQSRLRGEALLLGLGPRLVPPRSNRISNELHRDKKELPIYQYKDEICKMLHNNSIFIVNGETGSGKTTQIPQYILSEATRYNRPCRILVTQPRRIAAVSVAHRVAEERGEQVGDTVGYQIRMESRVRKTTNLVYTTSGCLLRSIMADVRDLFRKITHLIIDEIHERDKYTDFTLITVKEQLKHNKDLKVILMSATMDINLLSKYFNDCPVFNVPGQGYDVKLYHLEDILYHTGYRTLLMEKYLRLMPPNGIQPQFQSNNNACEQVRTTPVLIADEYAQEVVDFNLELCSDVSKNVEELWEVFDQLQYFIESEGVPVDGGHSKTGITPLIAACKSNCPKYVQNFIQLQASVHIRDHLGNTAADYAAEHIDGLCSQIIASSDSFAQQQQLQLQTNQVDLEKERLMAAYQQQFNEDSEVDHDLILSLLEGLYRSQHPGAVMVFLPGYNDIVAQRDLITSTLPAGTYKICILHGQMDSRDQWQALQRHGVRKIILSTNIGQTSITIPDLAYIIDSGKVKMKTFDSVTESSQLQSVWISQADANQRSGRAGRTQNGVCYRLYSTAKYQFMPKFCFPEFMRIPLTEICLYAKTLDKNCDVQTYLSRALNPPSTISVQNAVKKLQILQVFNDDESVTELGKHLVEIPLDVQLGKCLIYSLFFKCVDPVLTIVAFHSVKDPFILPTDRAQQGHASFQRKSFAANSFSDQKGILALYDAYMSIRHNKKKLHDFCNKYFLSQSALEMFCATRRQIAELISQKFRLGPNATIFNADWNLVRLCLVAGFYPNVALVDRTKMTLISGAEKQLILQRTSSLNPPGMKNLKDFVDTLPHDWIVFYEKSRLAKMCSINMNTVVSPALIALQCGREFEVELDDDDANTDSSNDDEPSDFNYMGCASYRRVRVALDSWINFNMLESDAKLLLLLRQFVNKQFMDFLRHGFTKQSSSASIYVQKFVSSLPIEFGKTNNNFKGKKGRKNKKLVKSVDKIVPSLLQLSIATKANRIFDCYSYPHPPFLACIRNLPYDANEDDVRNLFDYIHIVSLRLHREDDETGSVRGLAYIEFETRSDLLHVLSLPDQTVKGQQTLIDVFNVNEQQDQINQFRDSTNQDGHNNEHDMAVPLSWRTECNEDRNAHKIKTESDQERPRLNLKPRTLPWPKLHTKFVFEAGDENVESKKSIVFGAAKPVDTASRQLEIEERLTQSCRDDKFKNALKQHEINVNEKSAFIQKPDKVKKYIATRSWRSRDENSST